MVGNVMLFAVISPLFELGALMKTIDQYKITAPIMATSNTGGKSGNVPDVETKLSNNDRANASKRKSRRIQRSDPVDPAVLSLDIVTSTAIRHKYVKIANTVAIQ